MMIAVFITEIVILHKYVYLILSFLMRGVFTNANDIDLFLMIFPRTSLHYKLVPVQYRE